MITIEMRICIKVSTQEKLSINMYTQNHSLYSLQIFNDANTM